MTQPAAPRRLNVDDLSDVSVERRSDGAVLLRRRVALAPYPERLTDCLEHWAQAAPQRWLAAARAADGQWQGITYEDMLWQARAVGTALLRRGLDAQRPVVILSGNSLTHLTLAMGALWAGVPYASVSPAYSLLSRDFGKLRHVMALLTPGLVFAEAGAPFAAAIAAAVPDTAEVVLALDSLPTRASTPWSALLEQVPGPAENAAHAAVGPDTVAKFLFTSGSTRLPKAVTHTHRMLCSNQQMIRQTFPFLQEAPPVLLDWLPWNHTFGGNHNVGLVLYNGGTLYIDGGRPTAQGMNQTLRNLREVTPTVYFNVPKGFEELAQALEHDAELCTRLFTGCRAFFYAGAGLSQAVWDRLDRLALRTTGARVHMLTGLGMTETSPACTFAAGRELRAGQVGLPSAGVEVKLAPVAGKMELRFRGPHVMPGYWRAPDLTRAAFDEEGFLRTGDAVRFVDEQDPGRGLRFDGRLAEDFKLATGTFVSVGPLRARLVLAGAPLVWDAVITAPDRNEVGALLFPHEAACRALAGVAPEATMAQVLAAAPLRRWLEEMLARVNGTQDAGGSAARVMRIAWLEEAPSLDAGEVTDKGSINQSAVLEQRARQVEALYAEGAGVVRERRALT